MRGAGTYLASNPLPVSSQHAPDLWRMTVNQRPGGSRDDCCTLLGKDPHPALRATLSHADAGEGSRWKRISFRVLGNR
ncbi:hypothetical protein Plim_3502 [Planctopirus limnophila DSM 3776]|uniref:Uncharacterized protein n=1 Tax=Planctopirus limnophila (strain ATCC 43296 / DSM 3776 / IFAM 1008 / Mu 290) TaxID=521674 RepID=D5SV29_PLAL2|nr:hypothetical protein Plim_3502 [Planctopirus limnophila DSM 3776]